MNESEQTRTTGGMVVLRSGYAAVDDRGRVITLRLSTSVSLGLMAGVLSLWLRPHLYETLLTALVGICAFMPLSHLSKDTMPVLYRTRLGYKTLAVTAGLAFVAEPVRYVGTWQGLLISGVLALVGGAVALLSSRRLY